MIDVAIQAERLVSRIKALGQIGRDENVLENRTVTAVITANNQCRPLRSAKHSFGH